MSVLSVAANVGSACPLPTAVTVTMAMTVSVTSLFVASGSRAFVFVCPLQFHVLNYFFFFLLFLPSSYLL
jgi:hypothetical protein